MPCLLTVCYGTFEPLAAYEVEAVTGMIGEQNQLGGRFGIQCG